MVRQARHDARGSATTKSTATATVTATATATAIHNLQLTTHNIQLATHNYNPTFALTIWLNYMDNSKIDKSTEQKILEAAQKVFIKKGMSGARMQDIADEAGINKAMLHYYFRSKDRLFEVVFTEAIKRLVPRITTILESDIPLFSKIEKFCEEYITLVMANPYIPLFVVNEMNKQSKEFLDKIWGQQKSRIEIFFKQVEEEVNKGTINPIHPHQLLTNILSMTVFPFLAKPILHYMTDMNSKDYTHFMESRKKEIPKFIIAAIKK